MTKINRKIVKLTISITIIVSSLLGLFYLNKHIKNENLLFYKTGSSKKAILNSTWNMSFKEVERVTEGKLKDGITLARVENGLKNLLNSKRFDTKTVESMNLWSYDAKVNYDFFDNRLFRVRLLGEIFNPKEFDNIVIKNLGQSYGEYFKDTIPFYVNLLGDSIPLQYAGKFLKDSVSVEYRQFEILDNKNRKEHRFHIEITNLSIFNEIIKIGINEQKSIFQ
jgi:hypothetical protein